MDFTEKNNIVVKMQNGAYLNRDRDLLEKVLPKSPLHNQLRNVNQFNVDRLDGKIVFELLRVVSSQEISDNRKISPGSLPDQKEAEMPKNHVESKPDGGKIEKAKIPSKKKRRMSSPA